MTRAREMRSRAAILALFSLASCSICWRHDCASRNGCVRGSCAGDRSSVVGARSSRMRVGKGSEWTTKGFAPHREKGMLTVRERSQQVRTLAAPAEPYLSLTLRWMSRAFAGVYKASSTEFRSAPASEHQFGQRPSARGRQPFATIITFICRSPIRVS